MTRPLTIAHVLAPAPVGGLERVVQALAAGHGLRGCAVHVVCVFDEDAEATVLPLHGAAGVTQHVVRVPRRRYGIERARVARLVQEVGARLLHTHGYRADVVDAPAARQLGIPAVTTVHGFTGGGLKNRIFERLQVRAFRGLDAVVAVSQRLADQLAGRGVPPRLLRCIPNAWSGWAVAPLSRAEARRTLDLPAEGQVVGWVGRLSREKGADVFIDAVARLSAPGVTAAVVGAGRDADALRARAARRGIADRIRWCGEVADAASCFSAFDVFALSSRTEGTPIVVLEAMASGVPIVATRVGGVPDVLTDGEGWLVAPEDPLALAAALQAALGDRKAAAVRVAAAAARLAARFASGPWLDAYEGLYRDLVTDGRA